MRRPIEKLALMLRAENPSQTLGQLAKKYNETTERIMDALEVIKMIDQGTATYLPYPGNDLEGKPLTPWYH